MTTGYGQATIWATIAVIGVATYALRLSFILLLGRIETVPARVTRVLRFVPPAVLAALAIPAIVTVRPSATATLVDERLLAGFVAGGVAWHTEDVLATIVAGMTTLWVLRFVVL